MSRALSPLKARPCRRFFFFFRSLGVGRPALSRSAICALIDHSCQLGGREGNRRLLVATRAHQKFRRPNFRPRHAFSKFVCPQTVLIYLPRRRNEIIFWTLLYEAGRPFALARRFAFVCYVIYACIRDAEGEDE